MRPSTGVVAIVASFSVVVEEAVTTSTRGAEVIVMDSFPLAIWSVIFSDCVRPTVRVMFSWSVVANPDFRDLHDVTARLEREKIEVT